MGITIGYPFVNTRPAVEPHIAGDLHWLTIYAGLYQWILGIYILAHWLTLFSRCPGVALLISVRWEWVNSNYAQTYQTSRYLIAKSCWVLEWKWWQNPFRWWLTPTGVVNQPLFISDYGRQSSTCGHQPLWSIINKLSIKGLQTAFFLSDWSSTMINGR